jgi:O-antigen/teichoic acid export membrane protein
MMSHLVTVLVGLLVVAAIVGFVWFATWLFVTLFGMKVAGAIGLVLACSIPAIAFLWVVGSIILQK